MKNIIKSDFYYYRKNIMYFIICIVVFTVYFGTGELFMNGHEYREVDGSIPKLFQMLIKQNYFISIVMVIILTSIMQGKIQSNRFCMYQLIKAGVEEVMFSKYLVQFVLNLLLFMGVYGLATLCMCCVTQKNLFLVFLTSPYYLLIILTEMILLLNYSIQTVSIILWVKSGVWGIFLNWTVTVTALLPALLGTYWEEPMLIRLAKWTTPGQMFLLGQMTTAYDIMAISVITSLVEIIIFWFLTVYIIKRQKYT